MKSPDPAALSEALRQEVAMYEAEAKRRWPETKVTFG